MKTMGLKATFLLSSMFIFGVALADTSDASCSTLNAQGYKCMVPGGSEVTLTNVGDYIYVALPSGEFTLQCTLTPQIANKELARFLFGALDLDTYQSNPEIASGNDVNILSATTKYIISGEANNNSYRSVWFQNSYGSTPLDAYPITINCQ